MLAHLCDKEVTIQQNTGTLGADMTVPETWATKYANVRCRIVPLTARQRNEYMGSPMRVTHYIYVADTSLTITCADRVRYGDRIFRIQGIRNPHELSRFLVLDCEEFEP